MIELNDKQEEKLQILLQEFMKDNNIELPDDSDFITDTYYSEIIKSIEDNLNYLNEVA